VSERPRAAARTNIDTGRLIGHYESMRRIRAFEETAIAAAKEGLVLGAIHPSIGQEAVAVGVCGNLRRTDILLSTHRGHGHTMVKGADVTGMMCELFGRKGGVCGGKGGSMHIADFSIGMLGANGVVGANITIAAGAAHAIKLQGSDRVVCCIFGDGAINRGPFLEGLNWAKVFDLRVLYVCEDNGYAATTRTRTMTAGRGASARAESLGIPSTEVDGNDIVAVDEAAAELLSVVRCGGGPRLLVAHTYRLTGHTAADAAPYRSEQEVSDGWRNDPIKRCGETLRRAGVADEELAAADARAAADIRSAFETARAAPWPDPADAFTHVQDVGAQHRDAEAKGSAP
jgi:acetoin:2,6-dichlorophenolindophenol oxidoreductase subunit alpha